MTEYFSKIPEIKFEGEESNNPFAFKFYDENKKVLGKSMKEHLRFATCYWHTFTWPGLDPFGGQTFDRPWMQAGDEIKMAEMKLTRLIIQETEKCRGVVVDTSVVRHSVRDCAHRVLSDTVVNISTTRVVNGIERTAVCNSCLG